MLAQFKTISSAWDTILSSCLLLGHSKNKFKTNSNISAKMKTVILYILQQNISQIMSELKKRSDLTVFVDFNENNPRLVRF